MKCRVLIDANLPRSLSSRLRTAGADVLDLRELNQADAPDEAVYHLAKIEGRMLVTLNFRDFANVLRFPPAPTAGIVVVRMPRSRIQAVMIRLLEVLDAHAAEFFVGRLVVIEPTRIRLRSTESR